jgi:hypothetical protein
MPFLNQPNSNHYRESWLKRDDKIMDEQQEQPAKKDEKLKFALPLHPEFKDALQEQAQNDHRTLTNYILNVLADKIKWKGKI